MRRTVIPPITTKNKTRLTGSKMSIDQTDVVDFILADPKTGEISLAISDHLPWDEDAKMHMFLLQEKVNAYLRFFESGEIYETCPAAKGRPLIIEVVGKYPMTREAEAFFRRVADDLHSDGYKIWFRHFPAL